MLQGLTVNHAWPTGITVLIPPTFQSFTNSLEYTARAHTCFCATGSLIEIVKRLVQQRAATRDTQQIVTASEASYVGYPTLTKHITVSPNK